MARQDGSIKATMGGLTPDYKALAYRVKTSDVESWIQSVFDAITDQLNEKRDPDKKIPRVTVSLITLKASGKYAPFVLAMSKNVLQQKGGRKSGNGNKKEYEQFNVKAEDSSVVLWPQFYNIVGAMMYNKDDIKMLTSVSGRHSLDITRRASDTLESLRTPKMLKFGGTTEMVTVLLDPIRCFWMMLRDPDDPSNKNFRVEVDDFRMISKTAAEFQLVRRIKKNKGGNDLAETMAEAFGKKLRS